MNTIRGNERVSILRLVLSFYLLNLFERILTFLKRRRRFFAFYTPKY